MDIETVTEIVPIFDGSLFSDGFKWLTLAFCVIDVIYSPDIVKVLLLQRKLKDEARDWILSQDTIDTLEEF
jgi:hypothetical protein